MTSNSRNTRRILLGATALAGALALSATQASAQERRYDFDVPAQPLNAALQTFARQAQLQVIFAEAETKSLRAPPLNGSYSADEALQVLLAGTELKVSRTNKGVLQIAANPAPQSGSAAGGGAEVEALIVTAQKREEDIQDVPIAISAFSQEDLTRSQVAGGPDLMTQVPNMTFTKTNFSSYSIQIRGIGTQAISATVDPAVAVAFNNTPFVRNRFFEQEFYDLQRIEVLRGPQGTLYGRNATAGVVNIISAKPSFQYEAKLSGDVANYSSRRLEGMVNIPLVEDAVALRLAGAWTKRDGYVTNQLTGNSIDGRDLWSTRLSLRMEPTAGVSANLVWEHFEENDDRLRSGKQLCKTHNPTMIGGLPVPDDGGHAGSKSSTFSQGCLPVSMYSDEAFQVPNGFALPYYAPLGQLGLPIFENINPYASTTQSHDLRVIESTRDPRYRARSDLAQIVFNLDISPWLALSSETAYASDFVFSTQDFNRFNTSPGVFNFNQFLEEGEGGFPVNLREDIFDASGAFCDPQLGCSNRLVLADLSTAQSRHFSQEFRLSSDLDGRFNFNLGVNFLNYQTEDKYYVFANTLTLWAANATWTEGSGAQDVFNTPWIPGVSDNSTCLEAGMTEGDPTETYAVTGCIYIDPNPIGSLNDLGHNYFLSRNPYRVISYAAFGEVYYNITQNLKLTAGLRWTVDRKRAPRIPSWLIAGDSVGYPVLEVVSRDWSEPTGRLALDWKPELSFTDETLLYASYAHGYKAGGMNPPPAVLAMATEISGVQESLIQPKAFDAEFVDAFEIGAKNTLLDGRVTLNANAFYYDYEGYQLSQIINRSAVTQNFDAEVWGLEIEADWRPIENLRLGFKGGYEDTRVGDGMRAIDLMDRTAGDPYYVVARPFPTVPSNCILPVWFVTFGGKLRVPNGSTGAPGPCVLAYIAHVDPVTQLDYVADPQVQINGPLDPFYLDNGYPGFDPSTVPNNGEGIYKDLSGNKLPNAPKVTATLTADYTLPLPHDWLMTLHTDLYYQAEAWTRIFNMEGYDKLKAYTNVNFAAIFTNEDAGWKVMAYVKNVFDRDSITGAFLNSDDTGLTTNVFLTEPRLYGIRVTKEWAGGGILGGLFGDRQPGAAYPFGLELEGGPARLDAPAETFAPAFIDEFTPTLPFPLDTQQRDFDWGDARGVKLTYAPMGRGWRLSVAARTGEANTSTRAMGSEVTAGGLFLPEPNPFHVNFYAPGETNSFDTFVREKEEHTITDFLVGRDVGLGAGMRLSSAVSFGLRHAELKSKTAVHIGAVPNQFVAPDNIITYPKHRTYYQADFAADRDFTGLGPVVSWEGSGRLLGSDAAGHADLDVSLSGGVLFGRQRTDIDSEVRGVYGVNPFNPEDGTKYEQVTTLDPINGDQRRSRRASVPTVGASLGFSYTLDRLKVGAGYRWERYFDAIDGGVEERKTYDRTIDGPYFKLAIGFGG